MSSLPMNQELKELQTADKRAQLAETNKALARQQLLRIQLLLAKQPIRTTNGN